MVTCLEDKTRHDKLARIRPALRSERGHPRTHPTLYI